MISASLLANATSIASDANWRVHVVMLHDLDLLKIEAKPRPRLLNSASLESITAFFPASVRREARKAI